MLFELDNRASDLVCVIGRRAMHIFDKVKRRWISSIRTLAYENLVEGLQPNKKDGPVEV